MAAQVVSGIGFLGAGYDYLPEECGERIDYGCRLVGDGSHRSGVRYGNVCGCSYYHGDGAAGTGSAELSGFRSWEQLPSNLTFSAPSRESVKEFIRQIKQKGMEVHSYELKERRFSKEEFLEANIEIKAKRDFHTMEILDYMNDFSDVTISTIR